MLGAAFRAAPAGSTPWWKSRSLEDDRSTTRTGIFADEYRTAVDSDVTTWSLYAADTLDLTARLSLTLAGASTTPASRWRIAAARARSSTAATTSAASIRPSASPCAPPADLLFYGNVSQASRTPTAVELACADEDAPCSLPNAFLADPPLDEVVARSIEVGVRGTIAGAWAGTSTPSRPSTATTSCSRPPAARRPTWASSPMSATRAAAGSRLDCRSALERLGWSLDYTLVDATYRDDFIVNSPNHPLFGDDANEADGADVGR